MTEEIRDSDRYLKQALKYEGALCACLYRITRNLPDVTELLQETYARLAIAGKADAPEVRSVRAFALQVATNLALEWVRNKKLEPVDLMSDLTDVDFPNHATAGDEDVNEDQENVNLRRAVQELPDVIRQVWVSKLQSGYTHRQVADRLRISVHDVRKHWVQAIKYIAARRFDRPDSERPRQKVRRRLLSED